MSIMRRPLILRRPALFGLSGLEPFRHFFDAHAQCSNFLLLAKHDVAQISVRSLEERNLDLDLLQRLIVHLKYRRMFATRAPRAAADWHRPQTTAAPRTGATGYAIAPRTVRSRRARPPRR